MALGNHEIEQLIVKLRERYRESSRAHSARWFNVEAFEERLSMARTERMNMEGFILAEIANFEKIQERFNEKKKKKNSFSDKVDAIIEEHTEQITTYPRIDFHERAGVEVPHFYGALNQLQEEYVPVLRMILEDKLQRDALYRMEESLRLLADNRGERLPAAVDDFARVAERSKGDEITLDKARADYLKEGAFWLARFIRFCDDLLQYRPEEWDLPLRFDALRIEESGRKRIIDRFGSHTSSGAIVAVREQAWGIVEDFRLKAFITEFGA